MRQLAPAPVVELRPSSLPHHVHGTFFWDKSRKYVLGQILNAIETSSEAEFVDIASADIVVNPDRLDVRAAKVVWPVERHLEVERRSGSVLIKVPSPGRYTALYLRLA